MNSTRTARPIAVRPCRAIVMAAIRDSFSKLDPRVQFRNPVMFVVFVGSILTTVIGVAAATGAMPDAGRPGFVLAIAAWLWLTVLFANFAEAVAEGRGKAQAAALRSMRRHVHARRLVVGRRRPHDRSEYQTVEASALRRGDVVLVEANEHHSGRRRGHRGRGFGQRKRGDRRIGARAARGGRGFLLGDRRHARAFRLDRRPRHEPRGRGLPRPHDRDGRGRKARPHAERDRAVDPAGVPDAGVPAGDGDARAVLGVRRRFRRAGRRRDAHGADRAAGVPDSDDDRRAAVGDRHRRHGPHDPRQRDRLIRPRRSRRRATWTCCCWTRPARSRSATGRRPRSSRRRASTTQELAEVAQLASLADETPEGRSIVVLAKKQFELRGRDLASTPHIFHKFSAQTRMSGVDLDGRRLRKGAADAVRRFIESEGGVWPAKVTEHGGRRRAQRARRRWSSPTAGACSASSSCATSSSSTSASASRSCARWASRP